MSEQEEKIIGTKEEELAKTKEEKQKENEFKIKEYKVMTLTLKGIKVRELRSQHKLLLDTQINEVTIKLTKSRTITEEQAGFEVSKEESRKYNDVFEILGDYPILKKLRDDIKEKGKVDIVVNVGFGYTKDGNVTTHYQFIGQKDFEFMYYEPIHKEDKDRLKKLEELKEQQTKEKDL